MGEVVIGSFVVANGQLDHVNLHIGADQHHGRLVNQSRIPTPRANGALGIYININENTVSFCRSSTFIDRQQSLHCQPSCIHDLMLTEARLDVANHLWIALGPSPNRLTVLHIFRGVWSRPL